MQGIQWALAYLGYLALVGFSLSVPVHEQNSGQYSAHLGLAHQLQNSSGLWHLNSVQFRCLVMSNTLQCHETAVHQTFLSISKSRSLLKLMSIELVMPSNRFILCHPLLLLPSIIPSIRAFSNESALHIRLPKYWSFSFKISHSNEHPGLISFRMDWWDLLAVWETLKSLLQHHSSKHQFFGAQLTL